MTTGTPRRRRTANVLVVLGAGLAVGAGRQAIHGLFSHERWNWAEMAAYGVALAVIAPFAWRFGAEFGRRARTWGATDRRLTTSADDERKALIGPALDTGRLPANAGPDRWRPALRAQAQQLNVLRWYTVGVTILLSGLVGAAAALENDNAWGVWGVAVLVAAQGVAGTVFTARRLALIRELIEQLRSPVEVRRA